MKLEYQTDERWAPGTRLKADGEAWSLNVGMVPSSVIVAAGGILLGVGATFGLAGGRAVWWEWVRRGELDVGFVLGVFVSVLFWGVLGVALIRWQRRYGHLPAIYRVDEERGVFAYREERSTRWREWEMGKIREVRVRYVSLPGGLTLGVVLRIRIEGKLLALTAVLGRRDGAEVERFARRVEECAAARAVSVQ